MVRLRSLAPASLAVALALAVVLAPGLAAARAGSGMSMGSRGYNTYSAPPATSTAPYAAQPMQRSVTPQYAPSPGYAAPAPAYGYGGGGFGGRSGFASGLMGGLIGAGIGGMLFGHGMFGGIDGGGSILGLLIQLALVFFIGRWLFRMFMRQPAMAGGLGGMMRQAMPQQGRPMPSGGGRGAPTITIAAADYQAFEQLLRAVQAAWSAQNLSALQAVATPEMVGYFNEQLSELASRGLRNTVTDVRLEKGDLSQAWSEGTREYATVAMRFTMIDCTTDASGRVVDGSTEEHQMATEIWTFLRNPGGRWLLSAIQQTR